MPQCKDFDRAIDHNVMCFVKTVAAYQNTLFNHVISLLMIAACGLLGKGSKKRNCLSDFHD